MDNLKKMAENKKVAERAKVNKETLPILNNIIEDSKIINIVPEISFKEFFLEYFYNRYLTGVNDQSTLFFKWLELAGGVYKRVGIVGTDGKILFYVPSLYIKPNLDQEVLNKINFSDIMSTYKLKQNHFKGSGDVYLNGYFDKISKSLSDDLDKTRLEWESIFKKYGLIKEVANVKKSKQINDIINYD